MTYRKKLIEVSLPLEAINEESTREKSIRQGHPSTLHLWWSRKPLAACRAVLWSSLVDDPSEYIPDEAAANRERDRLFSILDKLIVWENSKDDEILQAARLEIARSVARELQVELPVGKEAIAEFLLTKAPSIVDPFAGAGSIPLEAQRLGLRAIASDLNPVAVLINKALIEIPPKFANLPPNHPDEHKQVQGSFLKKEWKRAEGLAEDLRYYGEWLSCEAQKRIGHLYPKIKLNSELLSERTDLKALGLKDGDELTVIAWLWARSVVCPNPACGKQMPLVSKFWLQSKGERKSWVNPIIDPHNHILQFHVRGGSDQTPNSMVNTGTSFINDKGKKAKATFKCLYCGNGIAKGDYIDSEANNGRLKIFPMAIVAECSRGRVYLNFSESDANLISAATTKYIQGNGILDKIPNELARGTFASNAQGRVYGFNNYSDYFLPRQQAVIQTLIECVDITCEEVIKNCVENGYKGDKAHEYADAIKLYLILVLDKGINLWSSLSSWMGDRGAMRETFAQQGIAMSWDFAEANPFSNSGGGIGLFIERIADVLEYLPAAVPGVCSQENASRNIVAKQSLVATDPPYYDNVSYADLMDFFYVWLRRSLHGLYPDLFKTILIPKQEELVASPYHFGGDAEKAKVAFEHGLSLAFTNILTSQSDIYPTIVFYAFKQTEEDSKRSDDEFSSLASTGWETMLEGLIKAGFSITGTWPIRTESPGRNVAQGSNALASSIALICRPRNKSCISITRRQFLSELKKELPSGLFRLQQGNIAPVDLAQAAIGPGMAIFSRYKAVLEADGSSMHVRAALTMINQSLDEYFVEQEGDYDGDTRWALAWFEQYGNEQGPYGVAETLSKAKNTSVEGLTHAGFLEARSGKVRLLRRDELSDEWDPTKDKRLTAWEATQYLIRTLDKEGEKSAGALLGKLGVLGESARDLAYRLYTLCERKSWAQDALAYNMLVVAWPRIKEQSGKGPRQESLL